MEKLIIKAIQTDAGYFIQKWNDNRSSYEPHSELECYFFDGNKGIPTHTKTWIKIPCSPTKVEIEVRQPVINRRYELVDASLASNKFPLVFKKEDIEADDGEGWKKEYEHLRSLYDEKYDEQPTIKESIDFEFVVICKIDNIKEYAGLSYPVQKTEWSHEGKINLTQEAVKYQVIDKIVFPDILLPSKPSSLSSEDTYKIIREYVKTNINPKYAEISSDYEFCFTVKKKIHLAEPYTHTWDETFSRKKVKRSKYVEDKSIQCFEMTYSPRNYQGYTPIKGFQGKNHEDLKKNIDKFLKDLIEEINRPLKECKHCKGCGVIQDKKEPNEK